VTRTRPGSRPAAGSVVRRTALLLAALVGLLVLGAGAGHAAPGPATPATVSTSAIATVSSPVLLAPAPDDTDTDTSTTPGTIGPERPDGPVGTRGDGVTVEFGGVSDKPGSSIAVILAVTLLSLAPAILFTCTCFTKILVVLSLTRNALGLQQTPPNQVLAGLALFLSLFVMSPVLSEIKDVAIDPYLAGETSAAEAWDTGIEPLRTFMLRNTDDAELQMLTTIADREQPATAADTPLDTLVPAFVLSELKDAFTIGFIIFLPFLVIDIVVSGALMALGMMMMPPVMVSLPFKLLLFVLVNGWGLLMTALVSSYG